MSSAFNSTRVGGRRSAMMVIQLVSRSTVVRKGKEEQWLLTFWTFELPTRRRHPPSSSNAGRPVRFEDRCELRSSRRADRYGTWYSTCTKLVPVRIGSLHSPPSIDDSFDQTHVGGEEGTGDTFFRSKNDETTMADDPWGDLFAKAADISTTATSTTNNNDDDDNELNSTIRTRTAGNKERGRTSNRKRKRQRGVGGTGEEESLLFSKMLEGRMDPPNPQGPWPSWIHLGAPLYHDDVQNCKKWKSSSSSKGYSECAHCSRSALHHRIAVADPSWSKQKQATTCWPMLSFVPLRNIRCCAKLLARSEGNVPSLVDTILSESDGLCSLKPFVWRQLPEEEANILESKLNDVLRLSNVLLRTSHPPASSSSSSAKKANKKKEEQLQQKKRRLVVPPNYDTAIRLIIACDAMYYRNYYLQLTKKEIFPIWTKDNGYCFLPHPSDYFGLDCLTSDWKEGTSTSSSARERLLGSIQDELDGTSSDLKWALEYVGKTSTTTKEDRRHPLAAIHQYRWLETLCLFYETGWVSSSKVKALVSSSLEKNPPTDKDSLHETPAPDLLMEWRDSCRDLMCNLYAYATVSPDVVENVSKFLKERKLKVVEIGAGTGYLSKLLRDTGIPVDAWDICPTDPGNNNNSNKNKVMNEYHGNTPPFYPVDKSFQFPISSSSGNDTALLLCYPPPESPMAYDTLTAYLRGGGKYLIHIGEFKGLTGNDTFEQCLVQTMVCQGRFPCLTWGTDASHVTLWVVPHKDTPNAKKRAANPKKLVLLLPCSKCQSREGTRRCRLLRSIVYCSQTCFDEDWIARNHRLRLSMLEVEDDLLEFSNRRQFLKLN
jgi:hypothetical protein